jgi:hypothetical protein
MSGARALALVGWKGRIIHALVWKESTMRHVMLRCFRLIPRRLIDVSMKILHVRQPETAAVPIVRPRGNVGENRENPG